MRVRDALEAARAAGVARLDAQLLLAHELRQSRAWLIAHDEDELPPSAAARFGAALKARADGTPLAYLVGTKEFRGFELEVTPAVLVPRPETELLVEWALSLAAPEGTIVDLGTGSGAVALALAAARPRARLTATDASAAALAVARRNGVRLGLAVEWLQGDWWAPLAGRRFDLAVSNPPYIAGDDPHLAALAREPRAALTPEGDGLASLRELCAGAAAHLNPGGWLLLEHGFDQDHAVRALLGAAGFEAVETRRDLAGLPRCTGGRRPM